MTSCNQGLSPVHKGGRGERTWEQGCKNKRNYNIIIQVKNGRIQIFKVNSPNFILKGKIDFTSKKSLFRLLRWNPPEVRVTSGQKSSTKIIYIVLQTSLGLF